MNRPSGGLAGDPGDITDTDEDTFVDTVVDPTDDVALDADVDPADIVLPLLESPVGDVPGDVVDEEAEGAFGVGYYDDFMGRMNGSVSYGPSEEEIAAERRRRQARHRPRAERSRSRDRSVASSSASLVCFPAQFTSLGEAFRNALVGRSRPESAA